MSYKQLRLLETQSHTLGESHMQALTSQHEVDGSCFKTEETWNVNKIVHSDNF